MQIFLLAILSVANGMLASAKSPVKSLKVIYFDARGAAELTRIILKVGKINFEDLRVPLVMKPGGGFEMPEYEAAKARGDYAANMNRLPLLEIDGMKIGQSKAMERYAAKKANLMGTSDEEAAIIDYISENVRDIKDKYGKIRATGGMGPNPEKEVAMKKWFDSECGEWLGKLEASLPSNADKKFTIGNKISYADINIWHLVKETFDDKDKANMIAAPYKRLTSIADHVAENDALKSWLASRPASKF